MTETAPGAESTPALEVAEPRATVRSTVLGLTIAYVGTAAWFVIAPALKVSGLVASRDARQIIGLATSWALVAALLLYVTRVERRPLSSIGFRGTSWTGYALTPVWWLVNVVTTAGFVWLFLRHAHVDTAPARAVLALPEWTKVAIVLTAAVTEEVLFRGYVVERLGELTGRLWLAGLVAALVFVAFHMPAYGVLHGLARLPGGIVLTIVYVRRRSLGPVVLLHFMVDLPLVFLR